MEEPGVAAPGWELCGVVSGSGASSVDSVAMGGFRRVSDGQISVMNVDRDRNPKLAERRVG